MLNVTAAPLTLFRKIPPDVVLIADTVDAFTSTLPAVPLTPIPVAAARFTVFAVTSASTSPAASVMEPPVAVTFTVAPDTRLPNTTLLAALTDTSPVPPPPVASKLLPTLMFTLPALLATLILPPEPVVKSPAAAKFAALTASMSILPEAEESAALTFRLPAELTVSEPEPFAVTELSRVMLPADVAIFTLPLLPEATAPLVVTDPPASTSIAPLEAIPARSSPSISLKTTLPAAVTVSASTSLLLSNVRPKLPELKVAFVAETVLPSVMAPLLAVTFNVPLAARPAVALPS